MTPLRVLLLAEACNPAWSSVPLVGYNLARALSRRSDLRVTVLTHARNHQSLAESPLGESADVLYADSDRVARPLYALGKRLRGGETLGWMTNTALAWPGYAYFEHLAARQLGPRLAAGDFDVIHRVTPVSPVMTGPLATRTDVPMMIGPINGGLRWPRGQSARRRAERETLTAFRPATRLLPYRRAMYRRLKGVIAGSRHAEADLPRSYRGSLFRMPENGVDPDRFPIADGWSAPSRGAPTRLVSVGRLVPCKGFDLILEAMAGSPALRRCEFDLIGDGPLAPALRAKAEKLGLAGRVRLLGWLDQRQVAECLKSAQIFVFPSIREFGGGAVLEAMASGLPCVVADYGGPAELVDDDCGVRVPVGPDAVMVLALRNALAELVGDPRRCRALGAAGVAKVREGFTWEAKAARIAGWYRSLLDGGRDG